MASVHGRYGQTHTTGRGEWLLPVVLFIIGALVGAALGIGFMMRDNNGDKAALDACTTEKDALSVELGEANSQLEFCNNQFESQRRTRPLP